MGIGKEREVRAGTGRTLVASTGVGIGGASGAGQVRNRRTLEAREALVRGRRRVGVNLEADWAKGTRMILEDAGRAETTVGAAVADVAEEEWVLGAAATAFGEMVSLHRRWRKKSIGICKLLGFVSWN